jgi:hypothetical protein
MTQSQIEGRGRAARGNRQRHRRSKHDARRDLIGIGDSDGEHQAKEHHLYCEQYDDRSQMRAQGFELFVGHVGYLPINGRTNKPANSKVIRPSSAIMIRR